MNNFELAGDAIRLIAVIGLPLKIWMYKSAAGVSSKTQVLYALVYTFRCLDLFTTFISKYNSTMKIVFITTVYVTLYLIYGKFKDTWSRNEDSFRISYLIFISGILAVVFNQGWSGNVSTYPELLERGLSFTDIFWSFSQYLEAVAIVPQLLMIYQDKTNETKSYIFYYLYAIGLYRALYVTNWMYKYLNYYHTDVISDSAGGAQLAIYIIFALFYVMRQPYKKIIVTPFVAHI